MVQTTYEDCQVGHTIPELAFTVDTLTWIKYCGASDDYARQHWDHLFMTEAGFTGVVGHGWLTFAYMCQAVTEWVPLEVADVRNYAVRYHRPTAPGTVRCGGEVVSKDDMSSQRRLELELWAKDAEDQLIASSAMTLEFV